MARNQTCACFLLSFSLSASRCEAAAAATAAAAAEDGSGRGGSGRRPVDGGDREDDVLAAWADVGTSVSAGAEAFPPDARCPRWGGTARGRGNTRVVEVRFAAAGEAELGFAMAAPRQLRARRSAVRRPEEDFSRWWACGIMWAVRVTHVAPLR